MSSSKITLSEAARLTGKDKTTLFKWIKSGRISATREGKLWVIDASELHRVTGFVIDSSSLKSTAHSMNVNEHQNPNNTRNEATHSLKSTQNQRSHFNESSLNVNAQIASLETEVRLLREMNEDLKTRLDRAEEDRRKITFLLEHQIEKTNPSIDPKNEPEPSQMPVEARSDKEEGEGVGEKKRGRFWRIFSRS